jgi:hypothetical protein
MLDALTITEEEAAGLAELAALDLAMAKDFAARAHAAEDPAVANDLAKSYQRVARSYRQSLALKMRLAREMLSHARELPSGAGQTRQPSPSAPPSGPGPLARRRAEAVHAAVVRVAWNEYEKPEDEAARDFIVGLLDDALIDLAPVPGFAQRPLDELVAEVCDLVGLSPDLAARWRDLPDPPAGAAPDPAWRDTG